MHLTSYPKDKIRILLLENVADEAVRQFQEAGYSAVTTLRSALEEEDLLEAVREVHILGIRSRTQVSRRILEEAGRLLAVGCFCIGTNQVDKPAASATGIPVFNSPYSNTRSVAELVIGAAIMLIRRIPDKNTAAHSGIWMKESGGAHELRGRTLGIIGYGNIGSQVSVLAESMGMQVVFYDIARKLPLGNARSADTLDSVLAVADILTVHVPATAQTAGMLNSQLFDKCRRGAIIINYARGEIMQAADLAEAIRSGHLGGAAADVFAEEPDSNGAPFRSPLQGLPNVLLTPHVGGSTEEAQRAIGYDVSGKLISFIESGDTQSSLSVPALSLPQQEGAHRILHFHRNVPGVLSSINSALAATGINILGQYLKTNESTGYVVLDVDHQLSAQAVEVLRNIPATIRVRTVY